MTFVFLVTCSQEPLANAKCGRNSGASNEQLRIMVMWPDWDWKHGRLNMEVKKTQLARKQDKNY